MFSGWAFLNGNDRHITGVEVFQGDNLLGVCDYGQNRADVYTTHPHFPQAQKSGFCAGLAIQNKTKGPLYVYAIDNNGRRYLLGRRQLPWRMRTNCFLKKIMRPGKNSAPQVQKKTCRPNNIPRKILIAGMAKTGTTGLFFKISNSLIACEEAASKTKTLFEPTSYSGTENERVLAKILLAAKTPLTMWGEKSKAVNYADFKKFNCKILILRDPRDRLISTLLYSTRGQNFCTNPEHLNPFLALLKKKEGDPASVSVLELIEARLCSTNSSLQLWKERLTANLNHFLDFRRNQSDFFNYKYEDFIQEKTQALEDFLGFPLTGEAVVEKSFNRVVRTKKSGDWQNWFLEDDVCFFRPIFKDFMQELGYENSWSLPAHQVVLPAHGSEYVRNNLRRKKKND